MSAAVSAPACSLLTHWRLCFTRYGRVPPCQHQRGSLLTTGNPALLTSLNMFRNFCWSSTWELFFSTHNLQRHCCCTSLLEEKKHFHCKCLRKNSKLIFAAESPVVGAAPGPELGHSGRQFLSSLISPHHAAGTELQTPSLCCLLACLPRPAYFHPSAGAV